jgi:hypothetical protein
LPGLARQRLSLLLKGALAKDCDCFLGRYFSPRCALMDRLSFGGWNIAFVLEAPDDASGIAGFFGCGTGIFRRLTHESYSLGGVSDQSIDRLPAHHFTCTVNQ